ncbi:adenosine deaminase AGSA-like [Mercenaria mercenaria]|uniref:adenosine deaminase AGSA-like n=1 Tax=Mercenaria mercenaria TaxID=6596 RepID=UPI00234E5B3E|nr:adenosine deaminase AGSA-like [Mercenaria mercenaria]
MELCRIVSLFTVVLCLNVSFKKSLSTPVNGYSISRKLLKDDYMQRRQQILTEEQDQRLGGEVVLSKDEQTVNERLLKIKQTEIDDAHYQGKPFGPQINFLKSKSFYEQSSVFKLIQTMPKGGALHVHDCSIADIQWLVKNVTYRDNCYMCYDSKNEISFQFFKTPPLNPDCPWKLVSHFRKDSGDVTKFDDLLVKTMILTDEYANLDINTVWTRFELILTRANGLINYKPVFGDYFYEALREFHSDNVQYVEVRALLPEVYELDGTTLKTAEVMEIYKDMTEKFLADNINFTGAKIIKTNLRFKSASDILADVKDSIQLLQEFPDHFAGYDLVGQEDPGKPLIDYLDALRYPSQQKPPITLPYFFHAGETDWQGTRVDDNLIDAVLLNTTRIGHGYALPKHPQVMKIVKQQDIAIEVNPISNQVLKLVDDMQNHPASVLLADGLPVVISSDDPAVWGAQGLSYDFYAAFMALSGRDDGLEVLKQLSMNSLIYSAMEEKKKVQALKDWQVKWKTFIDKTVRNLESILIG